MRIKLTENQLDVIILNEGRNKVSDRIKIYEDDKMLVVVPLNHKSSCKYGSHTPWCVAVLSTDEHYKDYTENGVLIYFIIKTSYQESDIKEYKFAYYHPYIEYGDEFKGWYDMSDYKYSEGEDNKEDEYNRPPDKRLLKFLIPEFIFNKVKEFIKSYEITFRENYDKKMMESGLGLKRLYENDPANYRNLMVDFEEWMITFRLKPFDDEYKKFFNYGFYGMNINDDFIVLYFNKKTNILYEQKIPYFIDIRNVENGDNKLFRNGTSYFKIENLITGEKEKEMLDVFYKNFDRIKEHYFRIRKILFKPKDEKIYLYPQYVEVGDVYMTSLEPKITNIYKDPQSWKLGYRIDVKYINGNVSKDVYFSDEWGVPIKYDKEKHNPL